MGENIRGKWKIKMNDLKSSQIIESLKLEKEIWCLSLLGFTAGSGAEKYYHRVVFQEDHFVSAVQEGETLKSGDWPESYWNNPDVRWKRDGVEVHFTRRNDKGAYEKYID